MEIVRDHDAPLAETLAALGSPTRLAIMRALRTPRALSEVDVRALEDGNPRPLARQTVRQHLDRLVEVGAVSTRPARREYGETVEYVVNHRTLFGLSEETRRLARYRPAVELGAETVEGGVPAGARPPQRPCLVLVKGLDEGRTFDLKPDGAKTWAIGRRRGNEIALDFDASVSAENARVSWDGAKHLLEDHPDSRNGTSLNFRTLRKGERAPLSHGDLVGVGNVLLLYWA